MLDTDVALTDEQLERKDAAVMADRLRRLLRVGRKRRREVGCKLSVEVLNGMLVRCERVERGEPPLEP